MKRKGLIESKPDKGSVVLLLLAGLEDGYEANDVTEYLITGLV